MTSVGDGAGMSSSLPVRRVDLATLATAAHITPTELITHITLSGEAVSGCIAKPAEHIEFHTDSPEHPDAAAEVAAVDTALISLAARPGVLDGALPKCLLKIGSQPLIGHVCSQLYAGGVKRILFVLGVRGAAIREALLALPIAHRLAFEFVDLGPAYTHGFARSLLAASSILGHGGDKDFLLCTPDHIFDASLVAELRTTSTSRSLHAIALIEDNVRSVSGALPPTAVRVQLEPHEAWPHQRVSAIGAQLPDAHGIEAGLYRCDGTFFAHLAMLSARQHYFTVANAMQQLVDDGELGAMMTGGRRWLALETRDQMDVTLRHNVGNDGHVRFPWQRRFARVDSFSSVEEGLHPPRQVDLSPSAAGAMMPSPGSSSNASAVAAAAGAMSAGASSRRLVLAVGTSSVRAVQLASTSRRHRRDFALVHSATDSTTAFGPSAASSSISAAAGGLGQPLLRQAGAHAATAAIVPAHAVTASIRSIDSELDAIAIELPGPAASEAARVAYLIERPAGLLSLAVPRSLPSPVCRAPVLPSAIEHISLRVDESASVCLTVEKRVPAAGWLLLGLALFTTYSCGPCVW